MKDYKSDINRFRAFNSQRSTVIRELKAEMQAASDARDYERAASFRDQLDAIERLSGKSVVAATDRSRKSLCSPPIPRRCVRCNGPSDRDAHPMHGGHHILHWGRTPSGRRSASSSASVQGGLPRYKVRTVGNDDFQSMREVVAGTGRGWTSTPTPSCSTAVVR